MSDGEEGGGEGGLPPPTPQNPPQGKPQPNPPKTPVRKRIFFELFDESDDGAIPRAKKPKPPAPPPPPARPTKAMPAPKPANPPKTATAHPPTTTTKTHTPKTDGRPADPIVGTVAHVTYPDRVEKGTVRGVHGRKYGAVWVEYPGDTTLYEVSRSLLFPTLEEAEQYREEGWASNKKPKPPRPHKRRV